MVTFLTFMFVNALAVLVQASESKWREKVEAKKKVWVAVKMRFFFFFCFLEEIIWGAVDFFSDTNWNVDF